MRASALSATIVMLHVVCGAVAASASEAVMLRAGEVVGPNVTFSFDAYPRKIIIRTVQAGVAGSRIAVRVDRATTPAFSHVLAVDECKFADAGSRCEVTIAESEKAFGQVFNWFKRARVARITVEDAGVMKIDETLSLIGFRKKFKADRQTASSDKAEWRSSNA